MHPKVSQNMVLVNKFNTVSYIYIYKLNMPGTDLKVYVFRFIFNLFYISLLQQTKNQVNIFMLYSMLTASESNFLE